MQHQEIGARAPSFSTPLAMLDERLLVPVREGFRLIGVGQTKGYELIAAGEIKLVKIGSKSLLTMESLRSFTRRLVEAV